MPYTYEYPRPALTVDAVVYALENEKLYVLLIQRKQDPYKGQWAFPGGFMDMDETPEEAVSRELAEETGIEGEGLVQIGAFGGINRDPRHRTVSIAYVTLLKGHLQEVKGADDAADARWFSLDALPEALAFDHDLILQKSKEVLALHLQQARENASGLFNLTEAEIEKVLDHIS